MAVPEELKNKYFFHFTHLKNLDSIVKNGLLCTNKKNTLGIQHLNVAAQSIQERRSTMKVTCDPKGMVHDYVPFYLCSTNPMFLSLVNKKNVDQPFVIFFAISIEYVNRDNVVFTNASANTTEPPDFFNDPKDLNQLDWEVIGTKKWGRGTDDELHKRMAEVLIYERVPITDIEYIVVWNKSIKEEVEKIFEKNNVKCPVIEYTPFKNVYSFHFTKFMLGRPNETLVTGPYWLKNNFEETVENIIESRKKKEEGKSPFSNISDLLNAIDANFEVIPELEGIFELETVNDVHSENVSDHTLNVVNNLIESNCYKEFEKKDQKILKLAAYLHDIGKGPKSKWKNGKQPAFADHPVDALPMLERILVEEIEKISDSKIRIICLLVAYHDLIGEIIGKGRDIQQLFDIINTEKELKLLVCLNRADVTAINIMWSWNYNSKVGNIVDKAIEKLNTND